jgi:hypothetical protein
MLLKSESSFLSLGLRRVILWSLVGAYTIALPHAIFVYYSIVRHFSSDVAGKIPILIIISFGVAYAFLCFLIKRDIRFLGFIVPCAIIVYIVIFFESNPNKYIHIPEYMLMSWLIFDALSIDYKGKGILILVFICSSMLGIVDELEQGIYPNRFYGWRDMWINSASTIIGILTLKGLTEEPPGDWHWIGCLKKLKTSLGVLLFGLIGAVVMCMYLYNVKAIGTFWGIYPFWLLGWSGMFLALCPATILFHWRRFCEQNYNLKDGKDSSQHSKEFTAYLWVFSPLVILFIMHALVVLIALFGWDFK